MGVWLMCLLFCFLGVFFILIIAHVEISFTKVFFIFLGYFWCLFFTTQKHNTIPKFYTDFFTFLYKAVLFQFFQACFHKLQLRFCFIHLLGGFFKLLIYIYFIAGHFLFHLIHFP